MTITWHRRDNIADGKTRQAWAWAIEITAHSKSVTGVDTGVGIQVGGNPTAIGFSAQFGSLAALEASNGKLLADAKYHEPVERGADLFIQGTGHDQIGRQIWRRFERARRLRP